jgi:hypothetical protein
MVDLSFVGRVCMVNFISFESQRVEDFSMITDIIIVATRQVQYCTRFDAQGALS